MQLSTEFKQKVRTTLLAQRENYGGSDSDYSKKLGINKSIYNRIKKGEIERVLSDTLWIAIGRELNVKVYEDNWKTVKTSVYSEIEDNLITCKETQTSMILVDLCGIGKTYCARHIVKNMKNAFYLDCSQAKTKSQFIRLLAKTIGLDNQGKYVDVKANLKYYLTTLEKPLIVLDEAGDLEYKAFLELKELWNATIKACAWYMMGADGLRAKINRGISNKKVGFAEIFSRFSDEYVQLIPNGVDDKREYLSQLIGDIAYANVQDKSKVNKMIKTCLSKEATLRHLETLIKTGI
ncbi:ATP-binding protein [Apibacter muscae]|uniref:ATP-binding protein n=1 Tax=Apibacter muscae TaxID=2509004 RepID=UPI0011AC7D01|nr:ATP-binding protein [Apibacter muscae]TWP23498.1 ATP-binding protein [Apibacter muscae]